MAKGEERLERTRKEKAKRKTKTRKDIGNIYLSFRNIDKRIAIRGALKEQMGEEITYTLKKERRVSKMRRLLFSCI